MIIQIDVQTAVIFFIAGVVTGIAMALWNVVEKIGSRNNRRH